MFMEFFWYEIIVNVHMQVFLICDKISTYTLTLVLYMADIQLRVTYLVN
jgi:hypothetical protein